MPKGDKPQPVIWYHRLLWALLIGLVSLLAAYGMGSRALYTGSWQQYFLTLGLLILAGNRLAYCVKLGIEHGAMPAADRDAKLAARPEDGSDIKLTSPRGPRKA